MKFREYALGGLKFKDLNLFEAFQALRNSIAHSRMPDDETIKRDMELFRPLLDELLGFFAFLKDYELIILKSDLLEDPVIVQHLRGVTPPPPEEIEINDVLYEAFRFSPVVFKSPLERYQGLFPLFHGHIEGEPIHIYDGHYLLETEKMQRHTIFYFGIKKRTPLDDEEAPDVVKKPAPTDAGRRLLNLLKKKEIPWHIKREEVSPWTIRDIVNDYARRTLANILGIKYIPQCYLYREKLSLPLWHFAISEDTPYRAFLLSGKAGCGKTALLAHLVDKLLKEYDDDLTFFLRGNDIRYGIEGSNILLSNFLLNIGLNPLDFSSFSEFFALLDKRVREELRPDPIFVIVLDAINEAWNPARIMREALDMISAARNYPWIRIIISTREEFLWIIQARKQGTESSEFYHLFDLFVPPPE